MATESVSDIIAVTVATSQRLNNARLVQPHFYKAMCDLRHARTTEEAVIVLLDALESCGNDLASMQHMEARRLEQQQWQGN